MKNGKGQMRTYHWCPKCNGGKGQWVIHKPSQHTGKTQKDKSSMPAASGGGGTPAEQKLKKLKANLATGMEAIAAGEADFEIEI